MIGNISRYISFIEVVKHGSFSSAAKSMFISQPALSSDIAKLEEELGTKLFFRTGRGVKLTEAGGLLSEYITKALSLIESGEDKLHDLLDLKIGHLTVGASDMTLRFFLLDYISIFRSTYPDIKIKITNAPSPRTLIALKNGEIDFGIVTSAGEEGNHTDIEFKRVKEIRDVFVCHPECPLANMKKVKFEDIYKYPLIMLEGETSTGKYLQNVLPSLPKADIELATSDLVAEFASRGVGVASVVKDFASPLIEKGLLKIINLEKQIPPRYMYLASLKNIPLPAAASRMVEIIEKEINSKTA